MILREATIKYSGNDPNLLTKGSHVKVCISCNECGRVRWISKSRYKDLCGSCAKSGENHPMYGKRKEETGFYGKHHSDETKEKQSIAKVGDNNPAWLGGITGNRDHVLHHSQCIKLNKRFLNSDAHHITKSIIIYIPHDLHNHIYHNLKTGIGMELMNLIALQFINGEL